MILSTVALYTLPNATMQVNHQLESNERGQAVNTAEFIFGQLLSFEMMKLTPRRPHQQIIQSLAKEPIMENQLLIIALLVVGLIANLTVMSSSEK